MKTTDERKKALLESFKNGLIVSCQVQKDDPIYTDDIDCKDGRSCQMGRCGRNTCKFTREQIKAIRKKLICQCWFMEDLA